MMNSLILVACLVVGCTSLKEDVDVFGLSKCQAEEKKTLASGTPPLTFTPVCKADGGYNPLQCHDYVKACWCVNPATGVMVDGTFQKIEAGIPKCDCDISCKMVSDPVCGTDGETYNSDCELRTANCKNAQIKKDYHGVCKPPPGFTNTRLSPCMTLCTIHFDPLCGTDNITYINQCFFKNAQCKIPNISQSYKGKCNPQPGFTNTHLGPCMTLCTIHFDPLCGTDNITYINQCFLKNAQCKTPNISQSYKGKCNPQPVHGGYSDWSEFGTCTRSCGGGLHFRIRYCTNPTPRNGGDDCSKIGDGIQSKACGNNDCPVNGGYTSWGNYSACTQSCGGGAQFRTRSCTNPSPIGGGRNCSSLGDSVQSISCNNQACPVNGGYTSWSDYGVCTSSCGGGLQFRIRHCTNPIPQYGGDDCAEGKESVQSVTCNNFNCTVLDEMVQDTSKGSATKGFSTLAINLSFIGWFMWAIIYLL